MKKIISLIVSIVMIASVFALAVPASAANVDPAFTADKSKIIAVSFPKAAANVNPDALIDGSYAATASAKTCIFSTAIRTPSSAKCATPSASSAATPTRASRRPQTRNTP